MRPGSFQSSGMVPGSGGVAATGPGPGGQPGVGLDPNTGNFFVDFFFVEFVFLFEFVAGFLFRWLVF